MTATRNNNTPDNEPTKTKMKPSEVVDRIKLIDLSSQLLEKLNRRFSAKRFRSKSTDKDLLAYARAFTGAIVAHNTVLRDYDLVDLDERIRRLEETH